MKMKERKMMWEERGERESERIRMRMRMRMMLE